MTGISINTMPNLPSNLKIRGWQMLPNGTENIPSAIKIININIKMITSKEVERRNFRRPVLKIKLDTPPYTESLKRILICLTDPEGVKI